MSEIFRPTQEDGSQGTPGTKMIKMAPAHISIPKPKGMGMDQTSAPSTRNMQFVLSAFRRWWRVVVPCGFVLAAIGVGIVLLTFKPVYRAEATLRILDATPFLAFETRVDPRRYLQTQLALLRSPLVIGPVVSMPDVANIPEIREEESPITWLKDKIKAAPLEQSELIVISFEANNPKDAELVVKKVVDTYLDLHSQEDSEQVDKVIQLLEEEKNRRIREVDAMRGTIRELAKQATGKDPFAMKTRKEPDEANPLADLQSNLVKAELERRILDARVLAYEESTANEVVKIDEAKLDRVVDEHPNVQKLKLEIEQKKAQLREYKTTFTQGEKDRNFVKLKNQIAKDEEVLDKLRKDLREDLSNEVNDQQRNEDLAELEKLRKQQKNALITENLLKDREKELLKNVKEATGETLQMEFKQAELVRAEQVLTLIVERAIKLRTEQRAPSRVKLARRAEAYLEPVEKMPYRKMALASFLGLSFPFLLIVGWEWIARRVSDSEQIELHTRLPVLGEIARLPSRSETSSTSSRRLSRNMGLFEESIDGLRTCLMLTESLRDMQTLAVTSASSGEGKTSISIQLAVSIARASGQRVLLIDGDMRSPDIHRLLQTRRSPGLVEVLSHQCPLQEGIVTDWSNNVHILPAGKLVTSPHKLLGNGELKEVLGELRQHYRYIVIDTPPILPASEALVLAKAADVCLVCAMRDVSRIDRVRRSSERLSAAGARPVGVVLNGVPTHEYTYHYGSYYGSTRRKKSSND